MGSMTVAEAGEAEAVVAGSFAWSTADAAG
jgi:hypothetical protein